jgi:hypothetical protein
MQYPVPQFTDVEDKIFGPLGFIQFGIMGGAGLLTFLVFSATKNIPATIVVLLFVGLPAGIMAFGKLNGRPLYRNVGTIITYFTSPRLMIFSKEGLVLDSFGEVNKLQVENAQVTPPKPEEVASRLKQLNYTLQQQQVAQNELLSKAGKLKI